MKWLRIGFLAEVLLLLCMGAYWPKSVPWIIAGVILWVILGFIAWLLILVMNAKRSKPYPWGTTRQRGEFWKILCFGFVMIGFTDPKEVVGADPTFPAPLSH